MKITKTKRGFLVFILGLYIGGSGFLGFLNIEPAYAIDCAQTLGQITTKTGGSVNFDSNSNNGYVNYKFSNDKYYFLRASDIYITVASSNYYVYFDNRNYPGSSADKVINLLNVGSSGTRSWSTATSLPTLGGNTCRLSITSTTPVGGSGSYSDYVNSTNGSGTGTGNTGGGGTGPGSSGGGTGGTGSSGGLTSVAGGTSSATTSNAKSCKKAEATGNKIYDFIIDPDGDNGELALEIHNLDGIGAVDTTVNLGVRSGGGAATLAQNSDTQAMKNKLNKIIPLLISNPNSTIVTNDANDSTKLNISTNEDYDKFTNKLKSLIEQQQKIISDSYIEMVWSYKWLYGPALPESGDNPMWLKSDSGYRPQMNWVSFLANRFQTSGSTLANKISDYRKKIDKAVSLRRKALLLIGSINPSTGGPFYPVESDGSIALEDEYVIKHFNYPGGLDALFSEVVYPDGEGQNKVEEEIGYRIDDHTNVVNFSKFQDFLDEYKTNFYGESGKFSGPVDKLANLSDCGLERICGKSKGAVQDVFFNTSRSFCAMTMTLRNVGKNFVNDAVNYLFINADIPGGTAPNEFFSFLTFRGNAENGGLPQKIQDLLINKDTAVGRSVITAYDQILNIVLILVSIFFIIVALANILQIQINVYAIKKIIPGMIIGIILAFSSMFMMRVLLEVAGYASTIFIPIKSSDSQKTTKGQTATKYFQSNFAGESLVDEGRVYVDGDDVVDLNAVGGQFVKNFFIFAAGILLFILAFLFTVRTLILIFMVPIAPLAFFSIMVPPLKNIWSRWWKTVSGWLWMPIVSLFWLWLAFMWIGVGTNNSGQVGATAADWLIGYIFGIIILYLAIKTPFTMAGEAKNVLDSWSKMGKKTYGAARDLSAIGGRFVADNTLVGNIYRGGTKVYDSLVERGKTNKENFRNGPQNQSVHSKRARAKLSQQQAAARKDLDAISGNEAIIKSLEKNNGLRAQLDPNNPEHQKTLEKANQRHQELIAQLKVNGLNLDDKLTYSLSERDKNKSAAALKEVKNLNKAQVEIIKEKTKTKMVPLIAKEQDLYRGGWTERWSEGIRRGTEIRKDEAETMKKMIAAESKKDANAKWGYLQANLDHIKDVTGQLEDVTKKEVAIKKTAIQATSDYLDDLKHRTFRLDRDNAEASLKAAKSFARKLDAMKGTYEDIYKIQSDIAVTQEMATKVDSNPRDKYILTRAKRLKTASGALKYANKNAGAMTDGSYGELSKYDEYSQDKIDAMKSQEKYKGMDDKSIMLDLIQKEFDQEDYDKVVNRSAIQAAKTSSGDMEDKRKNGDYVGDMTGENTHLGIMFRMGVREPLDNLQLAGNQAAIREFASGRTDPKTAAALIAMDEVNLGAHASFINADLSTDAGVESVMTDLKTKVSSEYYSALEKIQTDHPKDLKTVLQSLQIRASHFDTSHDAGLEAKKAIETFEKDYSEANTASLKRGAYEKFVREANRLERKYGGQINLEKLIGFAESANTGSNGSSMNITDMSALTGEKLDKEKATRAAADHAAAVAAATAAAARAQNIPTHPNSGITP